MIRCCSFEKSSDAFIGLSRLVYIPPAPGAPIGSGPSSLFGYQKSGFKLFPFLQFGRCGLLLTDTIMRAAHIRKQLDFFIYQIDLLLVVLAAGFGMNVA
jgi:hypothetical protein